MKNRMRGLTLALVVLVWCSSNVRSQDIHFTQFFATPLFTNPALTGHFDGTYRFSGVIRQQWISISPQPFRTFGGGIDLNAPLGLKPIGAGIHLAQDQTGLSSLTTTQFNLFLSGNIRLGSRLSLRLGGAGGGFQQIIDYSKLSFGEQFNGIVYDPSIAPTDVNGRQESLFKWNYSGGGYLEYKIDNRRYFGGGYALFNITEPNRSFNTAYQNPLLQRHNLQIFSSFKLLNNFDLMPALQYMRQGEQDAFLVGTAVRYHINHGPVQAQSVQLGIWGRTGDAANISAGFQNGNLYIGGAYDVNLSTLQPATRYRGGWEVAVIYTLSTVRENVKRLRQCPDYL